MKRKISLIICFLLIVACSFAQTEKQFTKAGNLAYDNTRYYEAIAYLKDALKFNNKNEDALYKIAMSYYSLKDYPNAASFFEKVSSKKDYPLIDFYAATNHKLLGNYQEAISLFQSFNSYYPIVGFHTEKATQEIASCYWALDQKPNEDHEIIQLDKPLNTGYSDFGASYVTPNVLQVSSLQSVTKNLKSDFQSKIYFFEKEEQNIKESETYSFPINGLDTMDYANGFFLEEKGEFYYNQCYTEHELGEKICDIYVRKLEGNTFGDPIALNLNTAEHTETQANLSINALGETEIYFVSDRPGGKGKLDIWKATQISYGQFSKPVNLDLNTKDNESTPFFDQEKEWLYFSSEWYYGFGGYDIFKTKKENEGFGTIVNLGYPINSSANDQYFSPTKQNTALLSSNREGAMQLRGSACCYDVFEMFLPEEESTKDTTDLIALNPKDPKFTNENSTDLSKIETQIEQLQKQLPATVYFHNDEPNPKTTATVTKLNYKDSYEDYVSVKPDYIKEFQDEKAITNWFQTVDESYQELDEFLSLLNDILKEQKMQLLIEGYCSPLALNDYNINLAKRRIVNLENYILKWNNGVLKSYFDSGDLSFKNAPFGEETADKSISDSVEDVKQSIYNPKAAVERRVSVIAVELF